MQENWPIVYTTMQKYGIGSDLSLIGAIGTIAKETASTFKPVREAYYLASDAARWAWYNDTTKHAAYDGGANYHGRGYIQTTHLYNYQKVQDKTGLPCVDNPDLLLQPEPAAHALCIYWIDRGIAAMCEQRGWTGVRRAVYGGTDPDGVARIQRVETVLGV